MPGGQSGGKGALLRTAAPATAIRKRTASFWLPVRTIAQLARLAAALQVTQGQAITQAIEELARREGLPLEAPAPDPQPHVAPRPKRTRRIADPPGPIATKYNDFGP